MIFERVSVGPMGNLVYIVGTEAGGEGFVVDPAFDPDRILTVVRQHRLNVTRLVLTHHHFDHINAATAVKARTGATILGHTATRPLLRGDVALDGTLADGEGFPLGPQVMVQILHTPGHSPGGICLLVADRWLITGDTLFIGNCGRTDLEGGDPKALFASLGRLKRLPDALEVCPGHDYGPQPFRNLGDEKKLNPALAAETYEQFLAVP